MTTSYRDICHVIQMQRLQVLQRQLLAAVQQVLKTSVTLCEVRVSAVDDVVPQRYHGDMMSTDHRPVTAGHPTEQHTMYINATLLHTWVITYISYFGRISQHFRDNGLFSTPNPCLTPSQGIPLEFLDETYPTKTREMGYCIAQYTLPTPMRRNCRVSSRRRCVHEFATSWRQFRRVVGVNTPVGSGELGHGRRLRCAFASPNPSAVVANSCTHCRRRRDATKQFRLVGVGGVYGLMVKIARF